MDIREHLLLLRNYSDTGVIKGILVRYAVEGFVAPDFCEHASREKWPLDRYGTTEAQLISKCSGFFIPADVSKVSLPGGQADYFIDLPAVFGNAGQPSVKNWAVARLGVRILTGRRADISLFLGFNSSEVQQALMVDTPTLADGNKIPKALTEWSARAVEQTENGFLRGVISGPLPAIEAQLQSALSALSGPAFPIVPDGARQISAEASGAPAVVLDPARGPFPVAAGAAASNVSIPALSISRLQPQQAQSRPVGGKVSSEALEAGAIIEERMEIGGGKWLPVPEGKWLVVQSKNNEITRSRTLTTRVTSDVRIKERVLVIRNRSDSGAIAAMIFRYALEDFDAPGLCGQSEGLTFLSSRYGTGVGQMLSKCSGFSALREPSVIYLSGGQVQEKFDLHSILSSSADLSGSGWIIGRIGLLGLGDRRVDITTFIRTNLSDSKLKQLEKSANSGTAHAVATVLKDWAARVVEQTENGFMRGIGSGVLPALDAPLNLAVSSLPAVADAVPAPQRPATPVAVSMPAVPSVLSPGMPVSRPPAPNFPAPAVSLSAPRPPSIAPAALAAQPPPPAPVAQPPAPVAFAAASKVDELAAELARLREELARQRTAQAATPTAPPPVTQAPPAPKARRLALIIGNDSYAKVAALQNARADARSVGASLAQLGYAVTIRLDLTERSLKDELRLFKAQIQGGDEVVFFFAGHGLQMGGANYILPTDIRGESEDQVRDDALPLQKVLDEIQERKARFTLAIIDACRDNPFRGTGRSIGSRGLAPTAVATGQMVMFSAGAGQQALDRLGDQDREPNGLFTRVLLQEMAKPGLSVDRVMRLVRSRVVELAKTIGHEQVPAVYDQSIGEYFMRQ